LFYEEFGVLGVCFSNKFYTGFGFVLGGDLPVGSASKFVDFFDGDACRRVMMMMMMMMMMTNDNDNDINMNNYNNDNKNIVIIMKNTHEQLLQGIQC